MKLDLLCIPAERQRHGGGGGGGGGETKSAVRERKENTERNRPTDRQTEARAGKEG